MQLTLQLNALVDYALSPQGTHLATFEKLSSTETVAHQNFSIWRLSGEKEPVKVLSFSHKNPSNWVPQWSSDDRFLGRAVSNEVHIYDLQAASLTANDPTYRILAPGITDFSMSAPGKCAIFIKEHSGKPGSLRVYNYTANCAQAAAQKQFFKADHCKFYWSPMGGKHVIAHISTEYDKTGKSYYGESNLYFVATDGGFDCRVDLDAKGPIHDVCWSPIGNEFVVVYGFMPSTSSLFDLKCNKLYTFACGPKNAVNFNGQGNLIYFGGFGNLAGSVEVWRRSGAVGRIGNFEAAGATLCEWSPDGAFLITATLTPRLRVDNGFKVWTLTGSQVGRVDFGELYQVAWVPNDPMAHGPAKVADLTKNIAVATAELKKEAYRPPSLRNRPTNSTIEAKPSAPAQPTSIPIAMSKEAKAVKKLQEKLDAIKIIKAKHAAGEQLDPDQITKMGREAEFEAELVEALKALRMN